MKTTKTLHQPVSSLSVDPPPAGYKADVASRRVDWRFLLPSPELGPVAYHGPADAPLVEALRSVSDSVVVLADLVEAAARNLLFDVVMLRGATSADLRIAPRLVSPGGVLYLELYGLAGWIRSRQGLRSCVSELFFSPEQLRCRGLGSVEVYCSIPDSRNCRLLVPLFNEAAMEHYLVHWHTTLFRRIACALVRAAVRSGLLARLLPSIVVLASKDTENPS